MELLDNTNFVIETFTSLINEERARIIYSGLLTEEQCDGFIAKQSEKAKSAETLDDYAVKIAQIHKDLSNVKLAGDLLPDIEEALDKGGDKLDELEKDIEEEIDKNEACDCGSDCDCEGCEEHNKEAQIDNTCAELMSLAESLGRSGNHKEAYEIERVANELQSYKESL